MRVYQPSLLLLTSLGLTSQSVVGGLIGGTTDLSPLYARSASGQDLGVRIHNHIARLEIIILLSRLSISTSNRT